MKVLYLPMQSLAVRCVSSNNAAEWIEASFDTMKADKRETGPSRHVGAAN